MKLEQLEPKVKFLVKDLLDKVGVDTSNWTSNSGYSWSFGSVNEPNLTMVWYESLREDLAGNIYFIDDTAVWADDYARRKDRRREIKARNFNSLINRAFFAKASIRVAIVRGVNQGTDNEKVTRRELDSEHWYPHHIDTVTRRIVVMRGVRQPTDYDPTSDFMVSEAVLSSTTSHIDKQDDPTIYNQEDDGTAAQNDSEFDPDNIEDARKWVQKTIVQRQGQGRFRRELLEAYNNRCAISECRTKEVLEAAHLFGYLGTETNHVTNGILLRSDLHTLYDLGLMAIHPTSFRILLSPQLWDSEYIGLKGKLISLPNLEIHRPSRKALELHADWARSIWAAAID